MNRHSKIGAASGIAGALGTAGGLFGSAAAIPWPTSNLAGYVVAGKILGGGSGVSTAIAAVGGPVVAGAAVAVGVGAIVGAIGYGLSKLMI